MDILASGGIANVSEILCTGDDSLSGRCPSYHVDWQTNMTAFTNGSDHVDSGSSRPNIHMLINLPIQIMLGLASLVANLLTLLALRQVKSKFHPHLLLVVNLTISDMTFGVRTVVFRSLQMAKQFDSELAAWFVEANDPGCARGLIRVIGSALYICTYINLVAMACDLYIGILLPFRYSRLVTRRRTFILCVAIWLLVLVLALSNYLVALVHYLARLHQKSYCQVRAWHSTIDVYVYFVVIYAGIIAMTYMYIRIFVEVKRCAESTPGLPAAQTIKQKRRKVVTSLLVLVTFLIGWLPSGILSTVYFFNPQAVEGTAVHVAGLYLASLPMANSVCDPIIYAIRLDKVRIGFRKLCGQTRHTRFDYYASEATEQVSLAGLTRENTSVSLSALARNDGSEHLTRNDGSEHLARNDDSEHITRNDVSDFLVRNNDSEHRFCMDGDSQ